MSNYSIKLTPTFIDPTTEEKEEIIWSEIQTKPYFWSNITEESTVEW